MQTTIDSTRTTLILTRTMPLNARKLSGWSLGGTPGGDRIASVFGIISLSQE